ncbi:uncharacterized protein Z519_02797 [Cladophialophora bantiana CBS 173.52]|uniref:Transcriptional regulatory protein n=1 Tax=Cladophialophora bantiana (strain ATCC 10958 / CBS 173.52 / CDC B-1940 / NIH 8579) TaxID=1442370 RepID=A0A0D2I2I4_CLAB1|nr:uncharacterized protein Z519_02797 [Cladophialophora bantiana CBS 173.52]KIW97405.1 hypothetical protein Z519_02797 [Cladophialophora bantiana CBS 173.52]
MSITIALIRFAERILSFCMGARQLWRSRLSFESFRTPCRHWSSCQSRPSGHSKWAKIKHDKGKADAAKSRVRTHLSADIIMASKLGGPDPTMNSRLAHAIAVAKKGQLSKTAIENAIAKGQGKSPSGQALENVTIEAMLPHGVAAMIECQTDNKARTLTDIRYIITKAGGTVTPTAFMFAKKGRVSFEEQEKIGVEDALEDAIEAGALDIASEENKLVVETEPGDVMAIAQKLQGKLGLQVDKAEVIYVPNEDSMVSLSTQQEEEVQTILDSLEEDPSLQNLYINAVAA